MLRPGVEQLGGAQDQQRGGDVAELEGADAASISRPSRPRITGRSAQPDRLSLAASSRGAWRIA